MEAASSSSQRLSDLRGSEELHLAGPATFRLPFDILYSIFLSITQEQVNALGDLAERPNFPIICSQVCREWRQMALEMPVLWSNICFTHLTMGLKSFDEETLWIERSKGVGLQIWISYTNSNRYITRIMRLLRPHVERWKTFIVESSIKPKLVRTIFDELRDARAPMLEIVRVGGHTHNNMGEWKFQAFGGGAPELRELDIGCGRCSTLPFPKLSKLSIVLGRPRWGDVKINIDDLVLTLSTFASTLKFFEFSGQPATGPHRDPSLFPVTLPKLRTLILKPAPSRRGWFQEFASRVFAPSLREAGYGFRSTLLIDLDKMGPFPFPGLRGLAIYEDPSPLPSSTSRSILSQLPRLQDLNLSPFHSLDRHVLVECCPALRKFTLSSWVEPPYSHLGLKDMIEARRHNLALKGAEDGLKQICITGFEIPTQDLTWLKENVTYFVYNQVNMSMMRQVGKG